LAIDRFAGDIQRLNARREETNCRTRSQNCFGKLRARANEMIAGIENEQQIQSVHLPDLVFAPAKSFARCGKVLRAAVICASRKNWSRGSAFAVPTLITLIATSRLFGRSRAR
jgi:hypothetical protein